jgi:hypothetical protein
VNGPAGDSALVHAARVSRPVPVLTLLINQIDAHKHHLLGHAAHNDVEDIKDENNNTRLELLPDRCQSFENLLLLSFISI